MIYKMIHKDLFDMPNDYYLAHCVNASYTLGAYSRRKQTARDSISTENVRSGAGGTETEQEGYP